MIYDANAVIVTVVAQAMRDFMLEKSAWRPADLLAVYFVGKIADAGAAHFGDRRVSVYRYRLRGMCGYPKSG